jgi:hypothetical protein
MPDLVSTISAHLAAHDPALACWLCGAAHSERVIIVQFYLEVVPALQQYVDSRGMFWTSWAYQTYYPVDVLPVAIVTRAMIVAYADVKETLDDRSVSI